MKWSNILGWVIGLATILGVVGLIGGTCVSAALELDPGDWLSRGGVALAVITGPAGAPIGFVLCMDRPATNTA